jgi:hypothetical protein
MMLSIIFEPMRFSQAPQQNRPGSFSCSHLQRSPERETSYFFAPTCPRDGIRFIRLESLLAWLAGACMVSRANLHANQPFKLHWLMLPNQGQRKQGEQLRAIDSDCQILLQYAPN